MKDYSHYTIEQLATDEAFRQWVLNPDADSDSFWEGWLAAFPDNRARINRAKLLVLSIHEKYNSELSDDMVVSEIDKLVSRAESGPKEYKSANFFDHPLWRVAALLFIVAGLSWLYVTYQPNKTSPLAAQFATVPQLMLVRFNRSDKEMTVLLSDKSVATLMKGSKLTYPARFSGNERKVILSGEAFFDIAKDPKKPFLVFANETVTKVLGTSFRVKAFDNDATVMVVVKTGLVSVYPQKEYEMLSAKKDREAACVMLMPNQQVVFKKKENRLEKGIVANPGMLLVSNDQKELIFDDKPVAEVLHTLENIYGIVIVFDAETLSSCVISAQFSEENLKQRMNAICQAIGATYEMVNGQIVVNSKGCDS